MSVQVSVDGRAFRVTTAAGARAGELRVEVNGSVRTVDAAWVDADTLSLIADGAVHEARVLRREAGGLTLEIDGRVFRTAAGAPASGSLAAGSSSSGLPKGARAVTTPMPGRVLRVLVSPGDRVEVRQAVVVVEAMKMENELRSPVDGVVRDVRAAAGTAVESGAVLLVIEP